MDEKEIQTKVREFGKALFSGESQARLDNVAKSIGLTEDRDIFDVEWEVERLLKEAIRQKEAADEAAIDPIYETVGAHEAMILWQEDEHIVVAINHGNTVTLHRYRLDNLSQEIAVPSDALQDLRNKVNGMREDLDKLLEAGGEKLQKLDDMEVEDEGGLPDDVESLDEPRIMGDD